MRESATLWPLVEQTNPMLTELASSNEEVRAEWDRAADSDGHEYLTLRFSDVAGSVTGLYRPGDFRDRRWLRIDMLGQYGRFLENRVRTILSRLDSPVGNGTLRG